MSRRFVSRTNISVTAIPDAPQLVDIQCNEMWRFISDCDICTALECCKCHQLVFATSRNANGLCRWQWSFLGIRCECKSHRNEDINGHRRWNAASIYYLTFDFRKSIYLPFVTVIAFGMCGFNQLRRFSREMCRAFVVLLQPLRFEFVEST